MLLIAQKSIAGKSFAKMCYGIEWNPSRYIFYWLFEIHRISPKYFLLQFLLKLIYRLGLTSLVISFVRNAWVAIVHGLWEPNASCLFLEENTIAIFACLGSIYSNKICDIIDRQPWHSP